MKNEILSRIDNTIETVTTDNGSVFKIGDLVTAYAGGFHKILGFFLYAYELGGKKSSAMQVVCEQIATSTFTKRKGIKSCHIEYLRKIDANQLITEKEKELEKTKKFLKENGLI